MIVTDALVLRRSDYREADRMLTLLMPEHGRLEAVARGCKKTKSPLLNAAELFTAGEYTLTETRGRYTVTQCAINECYYPIRSDYALLTHGAYMLYMLYQAALPDQPAQSLFALGLHALAHLAYAGLPPELITFAFEMHYMRLAGMSPRVDACVRCDAPITGEARFDAMAGGAVCSRCISEAPRLSEGARRILYKAPRTRFEAVTLLDERPEWPEAARHMRAFVTCHIEQMPRQVPDPPAART